MMLSDGHGLGLWDHGWVGERKTIYDRLCTTKDSTWRSFEVLVCCDQVPARVAPQKAPSGLFLATADNNILRGGLQINRGAAKGALLVLQWPFSCQEGKPARDA